MHNKKIPTVNIAVFDYDDTEEIIAFFCRILNEGRVYHAKQLEENDSDSYVIGWSTEEFTDEDLSKAVNDYFDIA